MQKEVCDDCEEGEIVKRCKICKQELCEDCANKEHGCIEDKVDDYREELIEETFEDI